VASISGGGNYVSDSEIMQWLALEQDRIYGDLRESMDLSRNRASFSDALNEIKTALHQANEAKPSDFREVNAQMKELLETYGSDPDYAELCKGLDKLSGPLAARVEEQEGYDTAKAEYDAAMQKVKEQMAKVPIIGAQGNKVAESLQKQEKALQDREPKPPADHPYDDNQLKTWDELIGGKLDLVNHNDQLNMIHIQQLKALGDQSSQLGSQFISSSDKTSSSIINNIA
jgi:hypothetical protein